MLVRATQWQPTVRWSSHFANWNATDWATLRAEHDEIFAWGLNTSAGRLGSFPALNTTQPTRIGLPVTRRCSITSVGLGAQTSWILTKEFLE